MQVTVAALPEATRSPWQAIWSAVAVVRVTSFDARAASSETRVVWGTFRAGIGADPGASKQRYLAQSDGALLRRGSRRGTASRAGQDPEPGPVLGSPLEAAAPFWGDAARRWRPFQAGGIVARDRSVRPAQGRRSVVRGIGGSLAPLADSGSSGLARCSWTAAVEMREPASGTPPVTTPMDRLGGAMAVRGPGVVTGGRSGIQASGGKGSAEHLPRAVFVPACYGAPRSQSWLSQHLRPQGPTLPPRGGSCAAVR